MTVALESKSTWSEMSSTSYIIEPCSRCTGMYELMAASFGRRLILDSRPQKDTSRNRDWFHLVHWYRSIEISLNPHVLHEKDALSPWVGAIELNLVRRDAT